MRLCLAVMAAVAFVSFPAAGEAQTLSQSVAQCQNQDGRHSPQDVGQACGRILRDPGLSPDLRAMAQLLRAAARQGTGDIDGALADLYAIVRSDAGARIRADALDSAANLQAARGKTQVAEAERARARQLRGGPAPAAAAPAPAAPGREVFHREGGDVSCRFSAIPELILMNHAGQASRFSYQVSLAGPTGDRPYLGLGGALQDGKLLYDSIDVKLRHELHRTVRVRSVRLLIDGRDSGLTAVARQTPWGDGFKPMVSVEPDDRAAFIRTLKAANAVQAVLYGPTGAQVSAFTFDVSRFRRIGEALSAANFRCAE